MKESSDYLLLVGYIFTVRGEVSRICSQIIPQTFCKHFCTRLTPFSTGGEGWWRRVIPVRVGIVFLNLTRGNRIALCRRPRNVVGYVT